MRGNWRDSDTNIVHIIRSMGSPTQYKEPHAVRVLRSLGVTSPERDWSRIVTMRCGTRVEINHTDDYIIPPKGTVSPILKPWAKTQDAPTCLECMTEPPDTEFRNDWGSNLRGA